MPKTYLKTLQFLAQSYNFSEMNYPDGQSFDKSDDGSGADSMASVLQADAYLLHLLIGMNDRDKVILLYQIMREAGYNLNHADCAKTLSITRERYMVLLKNIKKRSAKILQITDR